jgi:hypothetical protein
VSFSFLRSSEFPICTFVLGLILPADVTDRARLLSQVRYYAIDHGLESKKSLGLEEKLEFRAA